MTIHQSRYKITIEGTVEIEALEGIIEELKKQTIADIDVIFGDINFETHSISGKVFEIQEFTLQVQEIIGNLIFFDYWDKFCKTLTFSEQKLFDNFIENPWEIFSRDKLLDILDDRGRMYDRSIDSVIKRLRKKILPYYDIASAYGGGYYLRFGELDKDYFDIKQMISEGIYFVPQLQGIVNIRELVVLTKSECIILQKFLNIPNTIFTRENLLQDLRYKNSVETNIDVHIKRLRKKLTSISPGLEKRIKSERGVGYKWE